MNSSLYLAMPPLFVALLLIEQLFPLRKRTSPYLRRIVVNGLFGLLAALSVWAIVKPVALWSLKAGSSAGFGPGQSPHLSPLMRYVLVFLLMDMTFYWWHRANHRLPFLWRFHNVHHFDPDLDVSTALRFHFGELFLSSGFRVLQLALVASGLREYLVYEAVFQAATWFHHSNIRLPFRLEQALVLVGVTPRMHGIHHSQVRSETNSNYGSVFTWWDRLFGTLRLNVPQDEIVIGVPGYSRTADTALVATLTAPFRKQREYWPPDRLERRYKRKKRVLAE